MIPAFDIHRQNNILGNELEGAVNEVIKKGIFILGSSVSHFEEKFAQYIGVSYAVGVASGTDALMLSLLAYDVGVGDEVILPANCYPSVFAVTSIGAIPRLVDIDPRTYNIDPTKIPEAITKKTKAIITVHLYGQPSDMVTIMEIGKKYDLPIIEDCAQASGAEIKIKNQKSKIKTTNLTMKQFNNETMGQPVEEIENDYEWRKVGSIGQIGCFSFYPTKNLACFGDGGIVTTNNEKIYKKVKLLRMYGEEERYKSILLGRNSRLDELQAAILLVKLKYLDKWNERRREIAKNYELRIKNLELRINLPKEQKDSKHVYHLYVIRTKRRDALKKYLEENGVGSAIHYPIPIHFAPSFFYLGYKRGDFPESEKACSEILSLPMYPELTNKEVLTIVKKIKQFFHHD